MVTGGFRLLGRPAACELEALERSAFQLQATVLVTSTMF